MEPDGRQTAALLFLVLLGAVQAVRGEYSHALWCVGLLTAVLVWRMAGEIRERRWDARVRRWRACPALWVVLDALRDREAQRTRSEQAWARFSAQLSAIGEGLAAGMEGIALEADRSVARIAGNFDASFRGFGDRLAAEEQARPPREVRYL